MRSAAEDELERGTPGADVKFIVECSLTRLKWRSGRPEVHVLTYFDIRLMNGEENR
jgi:hypothetical protein